jgi:hypothetical protein
MSAAAGFGAAARAKQAAAMADTFIKFLRFISIVSLFPCAVGDIAVLFDGAEKKP